MHIRRSTIVISLGVGVFLSVVLLLSTGWVRSSFAPDWNLRDWSSRDGWNSWKDYLPGKGGSKSAGGSPAEGVPIGEQPGITPTPAKGNGTGGLYPEIAIKDGSLRKRLGELLARPVWSYEEALERNTQQCPIKVADKQVNQDQLKANSDGWARITNAEITKRRKDIVAYLEQAEKSGIELVANSWVQKGRGIVMTGGNKDTVQRILVALRILRHEHKCKLAVEVFSFPGEIKNQDRIRELGDLGATVKEIKGFEKVRGAWKNFQIKAAAIAESSFREVLYLDSDNIPLSDPSLLFDEPRYQDGGRAVFWPDFNKDHPKNAIWRILGVECNYNEWEVESGQMLIDKRGNNGLNLAALHIAIHMAHEQSFYYSLSGGDKDTFRYAFWALGLEYTPAPRWLSSLGNEQHGRFCGIGMLQYGLSKTPKPMFAHLNLLKHTYRVKPIFTAVKRPLFDLSRSRLLDGTTINVYTPATGGMCVEVKVNGPGDQLLVEEIWDEGEFEWFEEAYFKHGGSEVREPESVKEHLDAPSPNYNSITMSKTFNITVLPGDGIGPEVIDQAVRVLDVISASSAGIKFNLASHDFGGCAIDKHGNPLPDATLEACKSADAVLMGSVGGPKWGVGKVRPEQGLLRLRKELGLYANIRPANFASDSLVASSPLKDSVAKGVDFIVVRELIGGLYFGKRKEEDENMPEAKGLTSIGQKSIGDVGVAWDTMVYSVEEVQRITRVAAQIALAADPPLKIHSVDKANVLASSRLWRRVVSETIKNEFPQLELEHGLVDSVAMVMVQSPRKLNGVILTENLFGDILSDEASVIPGSLGLLPSASLAGPPSRVTDKTTFGLYEPIHGSAPDIAGQGVANPIGTILSAAMLLRYSLGLEKEAKAIEDAVRKVLDTDNGGLGFRSKDLGGEKGTQEIGDKIVEVLKSNLA